MKEWTGNSRSAHATLGARNYALEERQSEDFYATHPSAAEDLLRVYPSIMDIWEPACGQGHLAKVFDRQGKLKRATDLYDRGYGVADIDFRLESYRHEGWIVTNPPYKHAQAFCEKALELASQGVAMFLKIQFLEGKARKRFYETYPPSFVYVYSTRQVCAMNGNFERYAKANAMCYAWYIWDKTILKQETVVRWI